MLFNIYSINIVLLLVMKCKRIYKYCMLFAATSDTVKNNFDELC